MESYDQNGFQLETWKKIGIGKLQKQQYGLFSIQNSLDSFLLLFLYEKRN